MEFSRGSAAQANVVKYNDAVEKPQLRFKDFVDNSDAPFVPRLKIKHNALVEWNPAGRFGHSLQIRRKRSGSARKPLSFRNRSLNSSLSLMSRLGISGLGAPSSRHDRETAS